MDQPYLPLALSLITSLEGFEALPYQDITGTWTQGWGFTAGITRSSPEMSKEQALLYLTHLVEGVSQFIDRVCYEPLSNHQRAALCSFVYNVGQGAFQNSTMLKYLNEGAYGAAASEFLLWTHSKGITLKGLVNRRNAEMLCFNTKD